MEKFRAIIVDDEKPAPPRLRKLLDERETHERYRKSLRASPGSRASRPSVVA